MKKALLIVCAVICSVFYVEAQQYQDVVYLKNGSIVRGVIIEQVPGQSLKIQTTDGSQFVYQMAEVQKMTKELPTQRQPLQRPKYQSSTVVPTKSTKTTKFFNDWTIRYKGEFNIGYAIAGSKFDVKYTYDDNGRIEEYGGKGSGTVLSRPLFETIHGVEIGPYLFVGAGIGLQYYCGKTNNYRDVLAITDEVYNKAERWNGVMLPIFANVKFMYPINNDFVPYLNLGLGGSIGCYSSFNARHTVTEEYYDEVYQYNYAMKMRGGFYCDFGAGFRYKLLNFGIGLQHQVLKLVSTYHSKDEYSKETIKVPVNAFYIKVGVNF